MKRIALSKGYAALVDDEDFARFGALVWHASVNANGAVYARRHAKKGSGQRWLYLHREIIGAAPDQDVDHDNGDTLDCRRTNLKAGTTAQNLWNLHTAPAGRVPLRGVSINRHGVAQALIRANGKQIALGTFDTPELAAQAYEHAAKLRAEGRDAEIGRSVLARKQVRPWTRRKALL